MPSLLWLIDWVIATCHLEVLLTALNFYFTGIYYDPNCSSQKLGHAVVVVGYGFEGEESDNNKYWIIKNRYKMPKILLLEIVKEPFWNQCQI